MENNQPTIPETNDLPPAVAGQEFQAPEVSVNVSSVENNSPTVPPTPKTKGKLIPVLLIILILVVLGFGGMYVYKNFFVKAPTPTPTPVSTPEAAPDPTADWEKYTNTKYKFSLKYPKEVKNSVMVNGPFTTFKFTFIGPVQEASGRTQAELSDGYMITINVAPATEAITLQTLQLGAEKGRQGTLNAGYGDNCKVSEINSGVLDSAPTVEYTATDCMGNYRNILTYKGSIQYQITGLYTNSEYELIVNQILSTFKFTDNSPTSTPVTSVNKVKILDTSSWIEYSCNLISYKLPSNYIQQCHVGNDGIQDEIIYREKEGYSGSSIFVKQYDGGSRRQNWIDTIQASPSEVSKYVLFQESLFGTVSGLDVFASGGWWQGGYASPILIAHDKTIVYINGGRDYNEVTGKITRWDISDTIASTIKFIK